MNQYCKIKNNLVFLSLLFSTLVVGQDLQLAASYGYTFQSKASILGGEAKISDGALFNANANFFIEEYYSVELSYNFQQLEGRAFSSFWDFDVRDNIRLNYILLGGNRYFDVTDRISAFGGLKAGILHISSNSNSFRNRTNFALGLKGGAQYYILENFGLQAQIQLLLPITDVGASLWWSPGQGTSVGVSSNVSIVQLGGLMGLFYRLPF